MSRLLGAFQNFEYVTKTIDAATIIRRTGSLSLNAKRCFEGAVPQDLFDSDRMPLAISVVIPEFAGVFLRQVLASSNVIRMFRGDTVAITILRLQFKTLPASPTHGVDEITWQCQQIRFGIAEELSPMR